MSENTSCPIWGTVAYETHTERCGRRIDSPRAGGEYFITGSAESMISNLNNLEKAKLTSWLVEQRRFGAHLPEIDAKIVDSVATRHRLTVSKRADNLLRYFGDRVRFPGHLITNPDQHHSISDRERQLPLSYIESDAKYITPDVIVELRFYIDYLKERGWIETVRDARHTRIPHSKLTIEGHEKLNNLGNVKIDSSDAFVAMWFDKAMDLAWIEGIDPGIRNAGYRPVRVDQQEHVGKIDDQIIAEIRKARFVVADFTQGDSGARGGVYYEAGFAHGLGIPVIFTCRADALGKVHFDTRQYNHIVWETPEELREKLTNRIEAAIGKGPLKRSG